MAAQMFFQRAATTTTTTTIVAAAAARRLVATNVAVGRRTMSSSSGVHHAALDTKSTSRGFVSAASSSSSSYPRNVGVLAADIYFPTRYVAQSALEAHDGVSTGKYERGLEQTTMAFVDDREDIYSMALTATHALLEKFGVDARDVGRLEVGTETVLDKSKSVKSVLMSLFAPHGNHSIEGVDTINACFGGTNALHNAVNWVESSSWDGRYAIVVAGDIALYEPGPARPTGGAGVVAMLVGPDAPLSFERDARGSYHEHAYDFYKPHLDSEYPVVDGKLSVDCYLRALDACYAQFATQFERVHGRRFSLADADHVLMHSPYTKLVRKSFARMAYLDALANADDARLPDALRSLTPEQSYTHKEMNSLFLSLSADDYDAKVGPALLLPKHLGNTYTASLYTSLLSLIAERTDDELIDRRLLMFSYGSGLAASQWSMRVNSSLDAVRSANDLHARLAARTAVSPEQYTEALALRERTHSLASYTPVSSIDHLPKGTYYLKEVDALKRRTYERV